MKIHALLMGLFLFLKPAYGAVVSNTNIWLGNSYYPETEYQLTISLDRGGSFILFDQDGENLIYQGTDLGTGSSWYFANYGDVFNAVTISENRFDPFWGWNPSGGWPANVPFHVGYGDFYMGVNTGFLDSQEYEIFGWAHLRNTEIGVELLGSGVSYDYPGIIIGVPEPSSMFLTMLGSGFLLIRRKR